MKALDLNFGTQVYCRDGKCGKLARLAVDPDLRRVTDLIVEEGFLRRRARVLPLESVSSVSDDGVQLTCARQDLDTFPDFQEIDLHQASDTPPDPEQTETTISSEMTAYTQLHSAPTPPDVRQKIYAGIAPDFAVIKRGTSVKNADGTIGKLQRVLVQPQSGTIKHFVVHAGFIGSEQKLLPASLVKHVSTKSIFVFGSNEDAEALPVFTPDETKRQ